MGRRGHGADGRCGRAISGVVGSAAHDGVVIPKAARDAFVWRLTKAGKTGFACLRPRHYDARVKGPRQGDMEVRHFQG